MQSSLAEPVAPRSDWIDSSERVAADVHYQAGFFDAVEAGRLQRTLLGETAWRQETIRMFGREVVVPRRCAWFGDPGVAYRYSRVCHRALGWSRETGALREVLENRLGVRFNFVLLNLYRDGHDCMGWHADDEVELGPRPCIASLSFGAARRFVLRRRANGGRGQQRIERELAGGSLLVMWGDSQRDWTHSLPRSAQACGARVNLTFRRVCA